MLWKGIPYYTRLDYEQGGPETKADKRNVTGTEALPIYQINMPSPESLNVFAVIGSKKDDKITKKELIQELQRMRLIPVFLPSQPRNAPHIRLLAILEPLETHWQFIEVRSSGRRSDVYLTDQGSNALRIFGSGDGNYLTP